MNILIANIGGNKVVVSYESRICLNLDPVLPVMKIVNIRLSFYSIRVAQARLGSTRDQIRRLDFNFDRDLPCASR